MSWIHEDDLNTKFFHEPIYVRRSKNLGQVKIVMVLFVDRDGMLTCFSRTLKTNG